MYASKLFNLGPRSLKLELELELDRVWAHGVALADLLDMLLITTGCDTAHLGL